jgi:hypothetical protein
MTEPSQRYVLGSLTRLAPLDLEPFAVEPFAKSRWATGDYVVGEVVRGSSLLSRVELGSGRMAEVAHGDLVVGVLAERQATLEVVGSWREIGDDLEMQALTSAGLFGKATSIATTVPELLTLRYRGHVVIDGEKKTMSDWVTAAPAVDFRVPVILLIGTSMRAGKTISAKILIRLLKEQGMRVVGAKITGAGRYRDILSMSDAGADAVFDFVDVGLPTTICPEREYRPRLKLLLRKIAAVEPQVAVVEAGASPMEPYNGSAAIAEINSNICCTFLCASDPYAAVGVMVAFGLRPDRVTGVAASTSTGIRLIRKLTGVEALNVLEPKNRPVLRRLLREKLGS